MKTTIQKQCNKAYILRFVTIREPINIRYHDASRYKTLAFTAESLALKAHGKHVVKKDDAILTKERQEVDKLSFEYQENQQASEGKLCIAVF